MGKLPSSPTTVLRRPTLSFLAPSVSTTTPAATQLAPAAAPALGINHPQHQQVRHATLVRRPTRPYTFTQMVRLSDGSTFTHRTTSPLPLHRAAKDSRNTVLWQPSDRSLHDVEVDEAGKLAAFRGRYGRAWDLVRKGGKAEEADAAAVAGERGPLSVEGVDVAAAIAGEPEAEETPAREQSLDMLEDLITGYATKDTGKHTGLSAKEQAKKDKKKK